MKISSIYVKGTSAINEDTFLISEKTGVFGVFDGASPLVKAPLPQPGKSGALIAAEITRDAFASIKATDNLMEAMQRANIEIGARMLKEGIDIELKINRWNTTAAAIRIVNDKLEWIKINDSEIVIINNDDSWRLLSEHNDHDTESLQLWMSLPKVVGMNPLEVINSQLVKVRNLTNVTYGALNGEPEAMDFLMHGSESLSDIKHIILCTDGFLLHRTDPLATQDWDEFTKLYLESGLQGILAEVRRREESDPKLEVYPRFKMSDDKTAIAIDL